MSANVLWDDQRIFLAVLEEGSLSAAARKLGLSHPTVRSRIETLEEKLGTLLFTRSVNGLLPTETAEALREPARAMAMASALFVREASAAIGSVAGTVRVSVADFMGIEVVPAMLARLRQTHPGIRIELALSNTPADLLAREVDVAVRTVAPKQGALVARKVASIPLGLFASRAYVERRGSPANVADLAGHDLIGPDRNAADLAYARRFGAAFAVERLVLRTDSHPGQLAAARAGVGIAVAQCPSGERDPELIRILPDLDIGVIETWIVTHENLARVPRVRAVFDVLAESFMTMSRKGPATERVRPQAVAGVDRDHSAEETNMATKMQGTTGAQTAKGAEAGQRLKAEANKEENKVEARKGSELKKGAARVEERSKSSDGKSAGAKQKS